MALLRDQSGIVHFLIYIAIIKRRRQINDCYEQFTLPKFAKWTEIQASVLTNALYWSDKSDNSRRYLSTNCIPVCMYIAAALMRQPPVSATDTTAVFAAYEISTTPNADAIYQRTRADVSYLCTHTSPLSNEFIWRPEWENYRYVARVRAVTTTEDGTRAKFNYKRELTRAQLDIVHIYRRRRNEILVSDGSAAR